MLEELKKHLEVVNNEVQLKEHKFEEIKGYGKSKMSLKDEFIMDMKDHNKKLKNFEKQKHKAGEIKKTIKGLEMMTNNSLKHIELLKKML